MSQSFFSDLSSFTAMSGILDPEKVKEIMKGIFEPVKAVIQKDDGLSRNLSGMR